MCSIKNFNCNVADKWITHFLIQNAPTQKLNDFLFERIPRQQLRLLYTKQLNVFYLPRYQASNLFKYQKWIIYQQPFSFW